MSAISSQITGVSIVYSTVYSGADQRKHQSSASLAFMRGIHWWPVNFPHKWPVRRKMFPFDDVIKCALVACAKYDNNGVALKPIFHRIQIATDNRSWHEPLAINIRDQGIGSHGIELVEYSGLRTRRAKCFLSQQSAETLKSWIIDSIAFKHYNYV